VVSVAHGGDDHSPGVPVCRWHGTESFHDIVSPVHVAQVDEDGKDRRTERDDQVEQPMSASGGVVVQG
jgi:hypothetical protein